MSFFLFSGGVPACDGQKREREGEDEMRLRTRCARLAGGRACGGLFGWVVGGGGAKTQPESARWLLTAEGAVPV